MLTPEETLSNLLATLKNKPESYPAWRMIIQALTVGETYFFRNQAHLKALRESVLPDLIEQRRRAGDRRLRIWSAGCASGEEPYSLAMLLRDLVPDIESWSIDLLGTDINEFFLERARQGFYRSHSFRGETRDWLQQRWFTASEGGFQLVPEIRRMVRFESLNLISDTYPIAASMDIILCRNVTIYFDREETRRVMGRMYDTLAENGWLIVGHSEPQPEIYDAFTARNYENAIFYQRSLRNPNDYSTTSLENVPQPVAPPIPLPLCKRSRW